MQVPSTSLLTCLALGALASYAGAQKSAALQTRLVSSVGFANYDLATGELTRGLTDKSANFAPAFTNTDSRGFFATGSVATSLGAVDEWMDFGNITTDTGSDIVGNFSFGYGSVMTDTTLGGPGASMNLRFYDGITGFCADSGAIPTASFSFDSMPASDGTGSSSGWLISVDLAGSGSFASAGFGNAFGFGWHSDDDDGTGTNTGGTGPLLCYAGDPSDPLGIPDSNGQVNAFDIWEVSPSNRTCLGTFFGGDPPENFASWYLVLNTVDGSASVSASSSFRNGGTNRGTYTVTSEAVVGGVFCATDAPSNSSAFGVLPVGYGGPLDLPSAYGQILVDITDPSGELLATAPSPFIAGVATISLPVPNNLNLCGLTLSTQTIQLGGGIELHNAQDLVIGF